MNEERNVKNKKKNQKLVNLLTENFGLPPPGRRIAQSKKPKQNTQRWRRDGTKTFNEKLSKIQAIKSYK